MPSLSVARGTNAAFSPSYLPVAVITGGTSGIGKAMAQAFAHYTNGKAHIILIGRNRAAAEAIIASFPKPLDADSSGWKHEFISCDVQLMKNVRATVKIILERVQKINFLILSAGVFSLAGREETEEGIDKKLASRYYSRWAFIDGFLPALRRAKEAGEDAKVLSVLGAGHGGKIDFEDLGLKKNWGSFKAMMQSVSYNDLMVTEFAKREPEILFTHIFPGNVNTPATRLDHWLFKLLSPILIPLIWLFSTTPEVCAEYMWYAVFTGEKGMSRRGSTGDELRDIAPSGSEEDQQRLWDHTAELTRVDPAEA